MWVLVMLEVLLEVCGAPQEKNRRRRLSGGMSSERVLNLSSHLAPNIHHILRRI